MERIGTTAAIPFVKEAELETEHTTGWIRIVTAALLVVPPGTLKGRQMKTVLLAISMVATALVACQSTAGSPGGAPNSMLTNAGFVAKRATTPSQLAVLNGLPANKLVRQTANGKVTYLYADPAGCGCVHVGSQSAFQNFKGMQNIVYDMNHQEFGGGLDPDNIGDLSDWQPF